MDRHGVVKSVGEGQIIPAILIEIRDNHLLRGLTGEDLFSLNRLQAKEPGDKKKGEFVYGHGAEKWLASPAKPLISPALPVPFVGLYTVS